MSDFSKIHLYKNEHETLCNKQTSLFPSVTSWEFTDCQQCISILKYQKIKEVEGLETKRRALEFEIEKLTEKEQPNE